MSLHILFSMLPKRLQELVQLLTTYQWIQMKLVSQISPKELQSNLRNTLNLARQWLSP